MKLKLARAYLPAKVRFEINIEIADLEEDRLEKVSRFSDGTFWTSLED